MHCSLGSFLFYGSFWRGSFHHQRARSPSSGESTTPQRWPTSSRKILLLAHQRQLRLLPVFIPSEENIQADAASRFQSIPDWHLAPRVFHQILSLRGPPLIDLFASCRSAQTRRFFAWNAADNPEAIDALSQKWDFSLAFLYIYKKHKFVKNTNMSI
jgi:hypothetical protein